MSPRRRSEIYRLGVGVVAGAVLAATRSGLGEAVPDWMVIGSLGAAGLVAMRFPVHVSLSEKVSVSTAVFFVAVLLLPELQAAALVAAVAAVDTVVAAGRRVVTKHERPPVGVVSLSVLFNGAQLYLAALAAGAVLFAGGVSARGGIGRPMDLIVIAASALAFYVVNTALVATAVALATSRHPLAVVLSGQKVVVPPLAGLYLIGAISAFAAVRWPWLPLLAGAGMVLSYHTLRRRIEMRHESMRALERLAYEVDRRDPYTFQHSQRVSIYAHAIARKLGFSPAEVEIIQLAAKVHDIGKIRIPDSILLKPERLTEEERRVMETHPRLGFDILRPFNEYANVLDLVLTHHERYDGLGYPNGTMGRRLLLMAQVIPVADSLDAMTTARAYRPARSWDSAMQELRRGAGTQWNPRVVEAALVALHQDAPAPSSRPRVVAV